MLADLPWEPLHARKSVVAEVKPTDKDGENSERNSVMFDPASLILSTLFSLIGMAFFVYGKKQGEFAFLGAGGLLMLYPYFVSGLWLLLLIGILLTAAPFLARHFGS